MTRRKKKAMEALIAIIQEMKAGQQKEITSGEESVQERMKTDIKTHQEELNRRELGNTQRNEKFLLTRSSVEQARWCGVDFKRRVPAQVPSSSLDHGSKLRGQKPVALMQFYGDKYHTLTQ
ncbi:hypothetical protein TNCV_3233271 [Trichonephila clavipes]|nr:hypothetical protein TNCV_3233271 [Trichonephila clavipes]